MDRDLVEAAQRGDQEAFVDLVQLHGDRLYAIALPALTLVLAVLAYMMRMTRTAVLDVMSHPYIEMAVLKGVPPTRISL